MGSRGPRWTCFTRDNLPQTEGRLFEEREVSGVPVYSDMLWMGEVPIREFSKSEKLLVTGETTTGVFIVPELFEKRDRNTIILAPRLPCDAAGVPDIELEAGITAFRSAYPDTPVAGVYVLYRMAEVPNSRHVVARSSFGPIYGNRHVFEEYAFVVYGPETQFKLV